MKDKILKILEEQLTSKLSLYRQNTDDELAFATAIESLIKKDYVTMEEYILMRDDRNNAVKALKKLAKILEIINEEN